MSYQSQKRHYDRRRKFLDWIKVGVGCVDCGYDKHPAALDFDHVRGKKLGHVSRLIIKGWDRLITELMKCEVVCANCHRIRTASRHLFKHPL